MKYRTVHASAKASGIARSGDGLDAVDAALGDVPVCGPRLAPFAPFAREGVLHRTAG